MRKNIVKKLAAIVAFAALAALASCESTGGFSPQDNPEKGHAARHAH